MFTVYFDMDGTIANLYGVPDWLESIRAMDPAPYMDAKPLLPFSTLARKLHKLQEQGIKVGVISWLAKCSSPEYDSKVTNAKRVWLKKHLPSVNWDEINIVPYGTPKESFCKTPMDVLFDDEENNRNNWSGRAFNENQIISTLGAL